MLVGLSNDPVQSVLGMCNPISISRGEQSIPEKCCSRTLLIATLSVEQISDLRIELSRSAQNPANLRGRWFGLLAPCWTYVMVIILEALLFAINIRRSVILLPLFVQGQGAKRTTYNKEPIQCFYTNPCECCNVKMG